MKHRVLIAVLLARVFAIECSVAQVPSGAIAGRILDSTGAALEGARVQVTNKETGLTREVLTSMEGDYSVPALLPGIYQIAVEVPGFRRLVQEAIIEAGRSTVLDLTLQVGAVGETVMVHAMPPQMRYDSYEISGVVTRTQVQALPLNGRSFLELAKLEPGAQQAVRGSNNRTFVPLLGAPTSNNNGAKTRVTVDGGSIMEIGNGGSAMGFSQELVQEFQVSTVNFDLSTGATASGAVNVVTRSG